jgi:transposase InsO family protein
MTENNSITPHEQGALNRYAAVSFLQQLYEQDIILAEALRQAAARPWPDAVTGKRYAIRTLEDWWYNYQIGGFQALTNAPRKDVGQQRSTFTSECQEFVLTQRQKYPCIPVKVAYLRWIGEGNELPSLSTIYRFLQFNGYHRGRPPEHDIASGPSKAFEAPYPNDLWMTDFSPGPKIRTADGQIIATHLGALIDDHSRLLPYAAYYTNENTQNFHHALKEAIRRRGVPHKLYADNGSAFISNHTHIVCANLGIRLLHHKPYAAWSKGKIERVFSSIQLGFETTLSLPEERVQSVEELNTKFSHWLQTVYHNRQHSSTGTTPQARFQAGSEHLRQLELSESALDKLFQTRTERTVRKNGIIRIDNKIYEVDLSLRGRRVEVRYDPFAPGESRPEIYHKGHYICSANPVDLRLNSQLDQRRDYNDRRRS